MENIIVIVDRCIYAPVRNEPLFLSFSRIRSFWPETWFAEDQEPWEGIAGCLKI